MSDVRSYGADALVFDISKGKKFELRAPVKWLHAVSKPTFVFEGTDKPSNIASFNILLKASTNPLLHFYSIQGKNHFSTLAPITKVIAAKILLDDGPSSNIQFSRKNKRAGLDSKSDARYRRLYGNGIQGYQGTRGSSSFLSAQVHPKSMGEMLAAPGMSLVRWSSFALYLNRRLWPFTALNSVLTQFWCSLGTCGTLAGIDEESVISRKPLPRSEQGDASPRIQDRPGLGHGGCGEIIAMVGRALGGRPGQRLMSGLGSRQRGHADPPSQESRTSVCVAPPDPRASEPIYLQSTEGSGRRDLGECQREVCSLSAHYTNPVTNR